MHGFVPIPTGIPYPGCPTSTHPSSMLMSWLADNHPAQAIPSDVPRTGYPTLSFPVKIFAILVINSSTCLSYIVIFLSLSFAKILLDRYHLQTPTSPFIYVFVRDGMVFFLLIFGWFPRLQCIRYHVYDPSWPGTMLLNTVSTALITGPMIAFFCPWIVPAYSSAVCLSPVYS